MMLNMQRMQYILQELERCSTVYINELAKKSFVSPSTIRRDLGQLEREGVVRRVHGGAVRVNLNSEEIPYVLRNSEKLPEKTAIGHLAATLVQDGMYIFLDATTTVAAMLPYLKGKNHIRIITNSVEIAKSAAMLLSVAVFCIGGWVNPMILGTRGEESLRGIREFFPDVAFVGTRALNREQGLMCINEDTLYLKRTVLEQSRLKVVLCDHTKLDKRAGRQIIPLSKIDCLVTDAMPSEAWQQALEENGIRLLAPSMDP